MAEPTNREIAIAVREMERMIGRMATKLANLEQRIRQLESRQ